MTPVTAEQLAKWKRLADAATEGGWFVVRYGDGNSYVVHSDDERRVFFPPSPVGFSATAGSLGDPAQIKADMKFIAAARAAVPALVAEVERLREALRKALAEIESEPQCCGRGQPVVRNNEIVGEECCGSPEYGFDRSAAVIRAALPKEPYDG